MNTVLSLVIGGPAILLGVLVEYVMRGFAVGRFIAGTWMDKP